MRKPEPPPDFGDILNRKGKEFSEAYSNPKYWTVARRVETEYRPWRRARYMALAEGIDPELLWSLVKMSRQSSYRILPLRGEGAFYLRYTVPDIIQEELMLIDQQLAGRLISSDEQPVSHAHQERFIISALREEAIASSMLEGAATTRSDAKQMLASGRKPRTRGERMVVNNYHAISFIREHRDIPLTPEFLLQVQEMLTRDTLDKPDECGRFRNHEDQVHITDPYGMILHSPPPSVELPDRLQQLCDFANGHGQSTGRFLHPVLRACVIHFQLGHDHPFCDGNGRTARAMFYWAMLKAGYWLFEYLPISRLIYTGPAKYALAYLYTETDEFDVTYFLTYKCRIIGRARRELGEYITRKQQEMSTARQVFESDFRLNHRQRDVIVRMLRAPSLVLTIQDHQNTHGTAYGTARSDLLDLQNWEYIVAHRMGNRWEFTRGPRLAIEE